MLLRKRIFHHIYPSSKNLVCSTEGGGFCGVYRQCPQISAIPSSLSVLNILKKCLDVRILEAKSYKWSFELRVHINIIRDEGISGSAGGWTPMRKVDSRRAVLPVYLFCYFFP